MAEMKKKIRWSNAWKDARELVWAHRRRLMVGAVLMIINQAMGLVLPASTKYLIDVVIGQSRTDLLWKIALGGQVNSGPMTYAVNGRQYITVTAGNSLFAFALRP